MVALCFVIKPMRQGAEASLLAQISRSSQKPTENFNLKSFHTNQHYLSIGSQNILFEGKQKLPQ